MSAEPIAKIGGKQNANQVSVTGRIDRFDVYEGKHYTEVVIPATDESAIQDGSRLYRPVHWVV